MSAAGTTQKKLPWIILASFVLAIPAGLWLPAVFEPISFLGDLYVSLLKLIVIPLLMAQVILAVYRTVGTFTRRLVRVVVLFVIMFVVSFLIMTLVMVLLKPGCGAVFEDIVWEGTLASTSLGDFFKNLIPDNIFASMASNSILPCILISFVVGIASHAVKAEKAIGVVEDVSNIFSKILEYIMWLTPVGVFVLMGRSVASFGAALLGDLALYILLAWGGCLVITILVMILPVWLYAHVSPIRYIRRVSKVWSISLSTCSSAATLPHTIRVCNEEFGVPSDVTGIVVPLGCTIHMCGGAVSFCLLGFFTMQMCGVEVTAGLFFYMLLVATLMNMAAPGIPGGGIVLGATYLTILGVPTGFIGAYSGIYRLLDMVYTTINVTGDVTANVLIAEKEKRERSRDNEKCKTGEKG